MSMPIQDISVTPAGNKSDKTLKKEPSPIKTKEGTKETLHANSPIKTTERCDSRQSTMSNSADICRICHCEGEPDGPLISPCLCSGSLKFVHQACLQKWLKSSDTTHCELCKFDFIMTSKVKPYKQWERLDMTSVERRKITCSVMFHVIAITCVIWSLYVLIDRTTEEIRAGILEWPFWTKLIVVAIGFTGGVVFMYVQCKMYVRLCHRWRAYNCSIFIENSPEDTATRERLTQQIKETSFANPGLHELELL